MPRFDSHAAWRVFLACSLFFITFGSTAPVSAQPSTFFQALRGAPADAMRAAAASPDSRFLYVVGDGAISVMERDLATGALTRVETLHDARGGVQGLATPRSVAVSPDGLHVYVVSTDRSADQTEIAAFARSADDGTLRFIDSFATADSRPDREAVAISPDGRHVYVSGATINTPSDFEILVVFERDAATGRLSLAESQVTGEERFDSRLRFLGDLAMSADGRFLYGVSAFGGLATFERDEATGGLTLVGTSFDRENGVDCLFLGVSTVLSADGAHLYVVSDDNGDNPGGIVTFTRDAASGALSFVGCQESQTFSGVGSLTEITSSPDGRHFYAVSLGESLNLDDGAILVLARDAATGALSVVEILQQGMDGVDGLANSLDVVVSPEGRFVTSVTDGAALGSFARDAGTGALSFVEARRFEAIDQVEGLETPAAVAVSPDGNHVYVASFLDGAVGWYRREVSGELSFVRAWFEGVEGIAGLDRAQHLEISRDGRFLYVLSDGDSTGAIFERLADGGLSFVGLMPGTLDLESLVLSPDGRFVYGGRERSQVVWGFARDLATGLLTEPERFDFEELTGGDGLAVSPDGRFLYAADGNAIGVLERNVATGGLSWVGRTLELGVGDVAVSPDGRHLLATRGGIGITEAVVVFERDDATGALTLLAEYVNGEAGIAGLGGLRTLAVSPDGRKVHALGRTDNALVTFTRNPSSGLLTFEGASFDGVDGVDGIGFPWALAVSPDSRNVYVTGLRENTLVAFHTLGACVPSPQTLCLGNGRFRVEVQWRDFEGTLGTGQVVSAAESADSGLFWFFDANNWEMLVKVLDGCAITNHHWVFAAATTDVAYTLTVTDTQTGVSKSYSNPLGTSAAAITDTSALAVCP
ncbi:MAG: beta-propeller fold lactonase family protein [Acidobacteriota bacterium]